MKDLNSNDLADALKHLSDFIDDLDPNNLEISNPTMISVYQLNDFDDINSWLDISPGELEQESEALNSFRGQSWATRAYNWKSPKDVPPIVIYVGDDYTTIADGRGRINYVLGRGWKNIPAVFIKRK